jgi:hypothetical protein
MTKLTIDTSTLLDALLSNIEGVDDLLKRLEKIVLPWRKNTWSPPQWVRVTATGQQVGLVDPHLGGYGQSHHPRHTGWGWKGIGPSGQGMSTGGLIEHVEWDEDMDEETIKRREVEARLRAQEMVDEFLRKEFPNLRLLEESDG